MRIVRRILQWLGLARTPVFRVAHLKVPEPGRERAAAIERNDAIVQMIEDCDRKLANLRYIPGRNQNTMATQLRQKKQKLVATHILMVMALNGNPHVKARDEQERNAIVRATMRQ